MIELETTGGDIVDLYNDSALQYVVLGECGLAFEFVSSKFARVSVRFCEVRNLCVEQPHDWVPEESRQIEHLLIRADGPWRRVVFKAGGFNYEFDCSALCLILEHD